MTRRGGLSFESATCLSHFAENNTGVCHLGARCPSFNQSCSTYICLRPSRLFPPVFSRRNENNVPYNTRSERVHGSMSAPSVPTKTAHDPWRIIFNVLPRPNRGVNYLRVEPRSFRSSRANLGFLDATLVSKAFHHVSFPVILCRFFMLFLQRRGHVPVAGVGKL